MTDFNSLPHWNLGALYELESPALIADLDTLVQLKERFVLWREKLSEIGLEDFGLLIKELEHLSRLVQNVSGFASLAFAGDTRDQKAQSFMSRVDEICAGLSNDILFFELWWKELSEERAQALMASVPDYAYWLTRTRAMKPHTLSESQEQVINLKNITGQETLVTLYDSLTNRYRFKTDFDKENIREVSREELMVYVRSHQAEHREGAYRELYRVYAEDGPILGQIYQALVQDWRLENVRLRKHLSPQSVRNKNNDLSDGLVESLLRVCRQKAPEVFGRYFQKKAKALGLEKLRRYDLYAPLAPNETRYSFEEALDSVKSAYEAFSPRFASLALKVGEKLHLSARPQPGKQSGAFCASLLPDDVPWVLMSFMGRRQDLFTLAHELGHAIHSQLAAEHNLFHFQATLPLAETASTFGEMLLAKHFLERAQSQAEKDDLRFHLMDDAYATVGRQAFFALFEVKAHEMIEAGATPDEISEAYLSDLALQFEDNIILSDEFRWEWVSIPHFFHTPFYVYAYSFGQLLVYSLWRIYEKQGPDFAERFSLILSKGGSASPEDILRAAGLGPLNDDFWLGGFEVIEGLIP